MISVLSIKATVATEDHGTFTFECEPSELLSKHFAGLIAQQLEQEHARQLYDPNKEKRGKRQ